MPIRFFCKKCGKEIWQDLSEESKAEDNTIASLEGRCICSDCFLKKGLVDELIEACSQASKLLSRYVYSEEEHPEIPIDQAREVVLMLDEALNRIE
jgi:hypothetical protein